MKFNLKNRPKLSYSASMLSTNKKIDKTNEWFEGFEKELREELADFDRDLADKKHVSGLTQYGKGIYDTIKRILGEEEVP